MAELDQAQDRRRYRRVAMTDRARVLVDGKWHACQISDISGGGCFIKAKVDVEPGQPVMFYMRGVGLVKSKAVMTEKKGFAVAFEMDEAEKERLIDNLTLRANRNLFNFSQAVETSEQDAESADTMGSIRDVPHKIQARLLGLFGQRG